MKQSLFLVLVLLSVSSLGQINLGLNIQPNGHYAITLNDNVWLESGNYGLSFNGQWYSTTNNTLVLSGTKKSNGADKFGSFVQTEMDWSVANNQVWITTFKKYSARNIIIFTQTFPVQLTNTQTGSNTDVISAFPTFSTVDTPFNYLTFESTFASPHLGHWKNPNMPGGAQAGSPLALFDENLNTLVMSPLNNFMIGVQTQSKLLGGQLACGLQGKVTSIPAGYTHSTVITAGVGVNYAFNLWGQILLQNSGKKPKTVDDDYTVKHLGYWTDNGAYYYYLTEPGKNYEQTMLDTYNYLMSSGYPIKHYQFDSWWYYKGSTQGLLLWEPTTDVFPTGMKNLDDSMKSMPLVLHNRWFENDNYYHTQMNFPFITEGTYGLPLTQHTYDYLMGKAKGWGMIVYEQDWLDHQYLMMESTQNNVTVAHNWMMNMNNAALKLGITMQLCMPLPLHILQSTLMDAVTHIRASGDYQRTTTNQWQIGTTSMLLHSLGVFPFKDTFWSNVATQSGCHLPSSCYDYNAPLEALVATLSMGPVGPSDKVGFMDRNVVMATCRADGVILKPDVPATTMDVVFRSSFNSQYFDIHQVTGTYSKFIANGRTLTWFYILAADTPITFSVSLKDLGVESSASFISFEHGKSTTTLKKVDNLNPFQIPALPSKANSPANYKYWVIAPEIENSDYILLGEKNKFVQVSSARFRNWSNDGDKWSVILNGGEKEVVDLQVLHISNQNKVTDVLCTLNAGGGGIFTCSNTAGCSCS